MKITAIAKSHSNQVQFAFKTDPPLTHDVFQCALNEFLGRLVDTYSLQDGLFIVRRTSIPEQRISEYEQSLTNAEKLVEQRKQDADKNLEGRLRALSSDTGLPIE